MRNHLLVPFNSAMSRILGKSFCSAALTAAALLILINPRELSVQDDAQNDIPILLPHKPIAPKVNTTGVTPGSSLQQTVRYYVAAWSYGGWSPSATASFNVAGPTSATVSRTVSPVSVAFLKSDNAEELGLFALPNTSGIVFDAQANMPSQQGKLSFVQLLGGYNVTYYNGGNCSFNYGTGLDTAYPYDVSPLGASSYSTNDSPAIILYSNETEAKATFTATMYLLWTPNLSSSIPVPLGYVSCGSGTGMPNKMVACGL